MRALLFTALLAWLSFPGALAAEDAGVEPELRELQQHSAEMQKTLERVRRVIAENIQIDPSSVEKARAKVLRLAADPNFLRAAGALWAHPARQTLLVAELLFVVFMFFFRAWRIARARNWFTKLLTGLALSVVFWVVTALVLPAAILGEPFRTFVKTLYVTLFT